MTPANCQQCGAPLPVSFAPIVVCQYCGRQYHNVQARAPVSPPTPAPARPAARSATPLVVIAVATFGVVFVGVAVVAFLLASGSTGSLPRAVAGRAATAVPGLPSPSALVQWDSTEVQFFRGDGDVPNLVGVGWFGDGSQALVGLSGATGDVLWRSPSGNCDLFTDGNTRILRFETGKTFSRYDAKTGKQTWSIQLSDNLGGVALGEKCALLKLYMGQTPPFGIDTDTGKLAPCNTAEAPARPRLPSEASDVTATRGSVSFTGAVRTDSKPINPEPARLAITARRGAQQLWETAPASLEPVWDSGGFDRSVAFTPAGAFLFGRSSTDHAARFALVDTASGRIVYEKPAPGKVETRVQVGEGGGLAFVIHDQRLEAYVASTGALRWSIHR